MISGTYQLTGVAKRNYGERNEAGDTRTWKLNRYALSQGKYERRGTAGDEVLTQSRDDGRRF